jgi:cell division protein FtsW (lipid II flippase)
VTGRWRLAELGLLVFPVAFLALGLLSVALVRHDPPRQLAGLPLVFALAALAAHGFLVWRWPTADQLLLPLAITLTALGLVMIWRLDPHLGERQVLWVVVSAVALVATLTLLPSVDWLARYKYTWAVAGCLLILASFVFGVDLNGSGMRWWLGAGGVYFQPSEVFKVLLVVFLASYLAEKRELIVLAGPRVGPLRLPALPYLLPLLAMVLLAVALVVGHSELGAALLYFGLFLALLYVATDRLDYVAASLGAFAVGTFICYQMFRHVRDRVAIWIDPWSEAQGRAYQVVQALIALAAGGILGTGLGYGYPEYIPAVQTDFILAAIGEELGLLGTIALLGLYLLLVYRGFRVAVRAPDAYLQLLAAGLSTVLGLQALVILGGAVRLLPLTGIPLPFVSYGGSALLTNYIVIGLLLRISAEYSSASAPAR